jgi:hypothetical protein
MVFGNRLKNLHCLLIAFNSDVILKLVQATPIDVGGLAVERGGKGVFEKHPCVSLW